MRNLLTMTAAARRLGVHVGTLRKWSKEGKLDVVQLPGSGYRRVPLEEVERLEREMAEGAPTGRIGEPSITYNVVRAKETPVEDLGKTVRRGAERLVAALGLRSSDYRYDAEAGTLTLRPQRRLTDAERARFALDLDESRRQIAEAGDTFQEAMRRSRGRTWDP
ncbi:MAG: helix-turn-helix domain-containing protein [Dehalococcoidia bacterium]|nr:helix-turn-helix domain-containing protein [Dehalococcoidia bacterium]